MRNPVEMLTRYGRQLLVDGASLAGQHRLAGAAIAIRSDGSEVARAAAEVAARYLAGAGVGALAGPELSSMDLNQLDPKLRLLPGIGDATPPLASLYLAARPYGASVDVTAIDAAEGWPQGPCLAARVATVGVDLGESGQAMDAVVVGTIAADLLVNDLLGLEPLPAVRQIRWASHDGPEVISRGSASQGVAAAADEPAPHQLLIELQAQSSVLDVIHDDVQQRYPNEACGLVVRCLDGALRAIVCDNLQDDNHALDPRIWPRTARSAFVLNELEIARAVGRGEQLVCIYHSHCDAGAGLSVEDVRCASPDGHALYEGVGWLVLSVVDRIVRSSAMYHLDDDRGVWLRERETPTA